jgi:hypothetical protein
VAAVHVGVIGDLGHAERKGGVFAIKQGSCGGRELVELVDDRLAGLPQFVGTRFREFVG